MPPDDLAADVALVARALSRLGHVHAFGHVSARGSVDNPPHPVPGRLRSPTGGLGADPGGWSTPRSRWTVGAGGVAGVGDRRPLEAPLHLAVYAARSQVGAICRLHGPAVAAFAATGGAPPLLHGFGGMVEPVAFWDDPDLVAGEPDAGRVAAALGAAPAMLWPATAA